MSLFRFLITPAEAWIRLCAWACGGRTEIVEVSRQLGTEFSICLNQTHTLAKVTIGPMDMVVPKQVLHEIGVAMVRCSEDMTEGSDGTV